MHVHWVFVTKYRKKIFDSTSINILNSIFSEVCDKFESRSFSRVFGKNYFQYIQRDKIKSRIIIKSI